MKQIFSKEEIQDLKLLHSFFINQVCESSKFEDCIDTIMVGFPEGSWVYTTENVSFDDQQVIYRDLQSEIFNEIWSICKSTYPNEGWERKSLCLNVNGKYVKYVEVLAEENPIIAGYLDDLLRGGDFYGITRLEHEIFESTGRIDPKDLNIQILLILHYLTWNDQAKRIEDWEEEKTTSANNG